MFSTSIPDNPFPAVCERCGYASTMCASVIIGDQVKPKVYCSKCRVAIQGKWRPAEPQTLVLDRPSGEPQLPSIRVIRLGNARVKMGRER